jgi:hypothetical protein
MTGEPSGRLLSVLTRTLAPQMNEIEIWRKSSLTKKVMVKDELRGVVIHIINVNFWHGK